MGSHPNGAPNFDWTRQDCDVWLFNEAASDKKYKNPKTPNLSFQKKCVSITRYICILNEYHDIQNN